MTLADLQVERERYVSALNNLNNVSSVQLGLANARNPQTILDNLAAQKKEFQAKIAKLDFEIAKEKPNIQPSGKDVMGNSPINPLLVGGVILAALIILK